MMSVGLLHYLGLAALLFAIGTVGVLVRRNAIIVLMSLELQLNAVNLTFIAFSRYYGEHVGQTIAFYTIALAAVEAAVGLAIVIAIFRNRQEINLDLFASLKR